MFTCTDHFLSPEYLVDDYEYDFSINLCRSSVNPRCFLSIFLCNGQQKFDMNTMLKDRFTSNGFVYLTSICIFHENIFLIIPFPGVLPVPRHLFLPYVAGFFLKKLCPGAPYINSGKVNQHS